ncbi:MAG: guanylate kinase [Gammaproteobacteria bacterium]|nr:guanylate kinase [Gammaproteobacteria bacterium]
MNKPAGKLFVISAPSGAGKTSLVKELVHDDPQVDYSVSYTTRTKRDGEEDGRDYFFVSRREFEAMIGQGAFVEHARVFDNHYGTSREHIEAKLAEGKHVILEIDWQGAEQVRAAWPECISIFILPPSRAELERRLRNRATDADDVIARRMGDAEAEMSHWKDFDFVVVNDNFSHALKELQRILRGKGEQSRVDRDELKPLVRNLLAGNSAASD